MTFNLNEITHEDSLNIGSDDAPLKVVEYINLRCPDSKHYEENIAPFFDEYIQKGMVQRIVKHFDKEKYPLEAGNVLNQYLDYDQPQETYALVKKLFKKQDAWGKKRLAEIPHVAKEYGLTLQKKKREQAARISQEVQAANINYIPTVFVGKEAFVETIEGEELQKVVEDFLL